MKSYKQLYLGHMKRARARRMDTGDCGGESSEDFRTASPVGLVEREHSCGRLRADGALHGEAIGGSNCERHGGLAGRRILGGGREVWQERKRRNDGTGSASERPTKGTRRLALHTSWESCAERRGRRPSVRLDPHRRSGPVYGGQITGFVFRELGDVLYVWDLPWRLEAKAGRVRDRLAPKEISRQTPFDEV